MIHAQRNIRCCSWYQPVCSQHSEYSRSFKGRTRCSTTGCIQAPREQPAEYKKHISRSSLKLSIKPPAPNLPTTTPRINLPQKMKTTTTLFALAGLLSHATATCFESGSYWPNREEARSFIHDACYKNGGMFTRDYAPRQLKAMCPRSGGVGLEFVVQNLNAGVGFDLGNDDCYNRLNGEIFDCEHGGESTISGWFFR